MLAKLLIHCLQFSAPDLAKLCLDHARTDLLVNTPFTKEESLLGPARGQEVEAACYNWMRRGRENGKSEASVLAVLISWMTKEYSPEILEYMLDKGGLLYLI